MYRSVPTQVDLPDLEHEVLHFWHANSVFARSLEQSSSRPEWVFYEGPPTANGMPGAHHIEARVFKDVFPRYKTMKGFHVARKAGWDCHGLPVELAVEKELGFSGKQDIEKFGVAEFNARCRESVTRHTDAFARLTERMGYWVDMDDAYRTMDPEYIESVWWSLKQIFDKGLLVEDFRVAPWCPRDETGLSDHELAQGYETVVDPSVYVRFPLVSGPLAGRASLLVWTTTPWTLVSNVAVAVHPDVTYVVATDGNEQLVVAEPLMAQVLGDGWDLTGESFKGQELERWGYRAPFDLVDIPDAHIVILASYVTTDSGSGLVHQAPAFGADDLVNCRAYGLPMVNPVQPNGRFLPELPSSAASSSRRRTARSSTTWPPGVALPPRPVRAQLPALLALPHRADLLRPALLVRPDDRGTRGPAARERPHHLAPRHREVRPVRRLAQQQRRLGAVAAALLGHPAADLALRERAPDLRRVAGRAQ